MKFLLRAYNKSVSFDTREEVDFVVVGSGAAGGILAKELAVAGHSVVVLEQGPHLQASDFKHDEWGYEHNNDLVWSTRRGNRQTFRRSENEEAELQESVLGYAHNVGGSSVHFSGNFGRFRMSWRIFVKSQRNINISRRAKRAGGKFVILPVCSARVSGRLSPSTLECIR